MEGILTLKGAVRGDPAVDLWLDTRQPPFREMAKRWFNAMRNRGDDVCELLHDGCPVACVGDVPFAYVNVFRAHVNVGFFRGAEIEDPAGLLRGSGRLMRHVRLEPGTGVPEERLEALIAAAYTGVKALTG